MPNTGTVYLVHGVGLCACVYVLLELVCFIFKCCKITFVSSFKVKLELNYSCEKNFRRTRLMPHSKQLLGFKQTKTKQFQIQFRGVQLYLFGSVCADIQNTNI